MKFAAVLLALSSLSVLVPTAAKADTVDNYSFSVTIVDSNATYNGQTYTGTFQVDEQTRDVTNFATNLLGGSYTNANVGNVATISGGVVTGLTFGLVISAPDGSHSSGFNTGFNPGTISALGLNQNDYFGFLDPSTFIEGFGTPVFTDLGPVSATPEPSSLVLLASGLLGVGGLGLKSRFARFTNSVNP